MIINLIPQSAISNDTWINSFNGLSDTDFTYAPPGSNRDLYLYNFDQLIPKDVSIQGVLVTFNAYSSGGTGTSKIKAQFTTNVTGEEVTSSLSTLTLTASSQSLTLGGSSNLNSTWRTFKTSRIDSPFFGLKVTAIDDTATIYLKNVRVKIYCTSSNSLLGSRSNFDENNLDVLPTVSNGLGLAKQVKSEQINLLGDALYKTEIAAIKKNPNLIAVYSNDSSSTIYTLSFNITGSVNTPISNGLRLSKGYKYNLFDNKQFPININQIQYTDLNVPEHSQFTFKFVNAIAWIDTGSENIPLNVNANIVAVQSNQAEIDVWFSVILSGSDIAGGIYYTNSSTYHGVGFTQMATIPAGVLSIKILAISNSGL